MTQSRYQPDAFSDPADLLILASSGPEPPFDTVMQDFLQEGYLGLKQKCESSGLLQFASLGQVHPWLFRLTFQTKGFVRDRDEEIVPIDRHTVAVRFLPDYLRSADRFLMLRLIEPQAIFHPNISPLSPSLSPLAPRGAICLEVYPGESLIEIAISLHELLRWRIRQFDERDALNPIACAWGRENIREPIDDRPLFGQRLNIQWQPAESGGNK